MMCGSTSKILSLACTHFVDNQNRAYSQQLNSIIGIFRAGVPTWLFEQINFIVCNRRIVVESNFYIKLKKLILFLNKTQKKRHTFGRSRDTECLLVLPIL